jgi:hypothetical protein
MSLVTEQHSMRNPPAVLHWYDFLRPFCYIGQRARNGDACRGHAKESGESPGRGKGRIGLSSPWNGRPTECLRISAAVLVKELDLPKRGNTRMVRSTRPLAEDISRANSMEST